MPDSFTARFIRPRLTLCAILLVPAFAQSETTLQEGLWEVTVKMDVGGQLATEAPLVTRQCITQQTAQDLINQLAGAAGGCQVSNVEQTGNEASWYLSCNGQVQVQGTGKLTLTSRGFDGSLDAWVTISDRKVPVHQTFSAQRIGECQ